MTKIRVYPVCIGPDGFPGELFSPFYPLGCIVAYAKTFEGGRLADSFQFEQITPRERRETRRIVDSLPTEPAVFLLSSYVWNHAVNIEFARAAKERLPESLFLIGGPHIPRNEGECRTFFDGHPELAVAARHEGEVTLAELLATIADAGVDLPDLGRVDFSGVHGITFRKDGGLVRTPDRARTMNLEIYPSPYTTGEFDHWVDGRHHVPLETNRGCPYGCTFCDWGAATLQKIAKMSMERVAAEIDYFGRKRIRIIGICDANFGIFPRDAEIARLLVDAKERYGFPEAVGYTNAKNATSKLLDVIRILKEGGLINAGQISIQTIDEKVLSNVERSNIKTAEYRKLITFFHELGLPAQSDMMLGLPGQTLETCKTDLQFFFDHKVSPNIYATSAMPNAPMSSEPYRRHFEIVIGADGMVESTYSFTREDYARMFQLCLAYKLLVRHGILKYFLYFAQLDHGVKALEFVARWLEKAETEPEAYPLFHRIRNLVLARDVTGIHKDWMLMSWDEACGEILVGSPAALQQEALSLCRREFGVELAGSDVEAVLRVSREVLPKKERPSTTRVELEHDVVGYFDDLRKTPSLEPRPEGLVPLKARGPCALEVVGEPCTHYRFGELWVGTGSLELPSRLSI